MKNKMIFKKYCLLIYEKIYFTIQSATEYDSIAGAESPF
ncbi:hypothetical protein FLA_3143 [Filimonas lacunae]|nr:hypothetical protein FLA_3143 [Filimonas lacunae]